ncbi:ABC transporter permease [Sphingosinicella sp. LHD-64]|uniref:ABC transporter permease n=1 Tax=Sphingosinicella sp. LHD-64 TaxID=3072139 RepID=UPI00280C9CA4|nr:ABC transporter permease [Sphingosinicella sp. LHD-64]MDQ8756103.1 ABC transporter permease [Sphingosinicella sp. LHD-64]
MWTSYLTAGLRAFARNRTYALINVLGLALGFAACLMILLYVRYELSYDSWVPNAENIYQMQTDYAPQDNGDDPNLQMSSYVSGLAIARDFPQVERRVYLLPNTATVIRNGQAFAVPEAAMVDGPFFDVFAFPLVHGDPRTALAEPGSVVLSESEALRLFGAGNPVGETLTVAVQGRNVDHRVGGVMRDLPRNSHMRLRMLTRFDPAGFFGANSDFFTDWGWQAGWVYVALRPGSTAEEIHRQMPAWEARNIPVSAEVDFRAQQDYRLIGLRDVHLGEAQDGAAVRGNDRTTIATFAIVAALVLATACFNFINLSTASASRRAREVALRKVLGARRQQLVVQFLGESLLVATVAMLIALAAVELLLAPYAAFLDADLSIAYLGSGGLLLPILGLVLLIGIAGGLYPAFYLSRFQPGLVLKANRSAAEMPGTGRIRTLLVITQFSVSIGLIICTAIIYAQTVYARTVDPGYRSGGLIQIANVSDGRVASVAEALMRELRGIDGVEAVARTNVGVGTTGNVTQRVQVPRVAEPVEISSAPVGPNFFQTMEIEPLAGRLFEENRAADDATRASPRDEAADRALAARGINILINARAATALGFRSPRAAIGQQVRAELLGEDIGPVPLTIVGVVEDSRFRSVRDPIRATMFRQSRGALDWLMVRHSGDDAQGAQRAIEATWKRLVLDVPFEARTSETIIADLYAAERARAQTFAAFALLAVLIACMGLFGLAAFTAERRTREIGIRKVFGASTMDILKLLVWQFSKPVLIANLIAWPVAWWAMREWLNGFEARIDLGPAPFVIAAMLALAIAIGTIAGHAIKVARANPIHALRYE